VIEFDQSIRIGDLLTVVVAIVGGMAGIVKIRGDVDSVRSGQILAAEQHAQALEQHTKRFEHLEKKVDAIAEATVTMARQDERMNGFEHRLSAIEEDMRLRRHGISS
jgi:ribosome-binding ATPase YchF (GTP1/OBG family)